MRRRSTTSVYATLFGLILAGCASHEVVPSKGPHAPTAPRQVKLYQGPPQRYEELGLVSVEILPNMKWDEQGEARAAFDAMKAKAAALGANGLLLTVDPSKWDVKVIAGYDNTFYKVPLRLTPKTAMAQAIFVIDE